MGVGQPPPVFRVLVLQLAQRLDPVRGRVRGEDARDVLGADPRVDGRHQRSLGGGAQAGQVHFLPAPAVTEPGLVELDDVLHHPSLIDDHGDDHHHGVGDGPLPVVDGVLGHPGVPLPQPEHDVREAAVALPRPLELEHGVHDVVVALEQAGGQFLQRLPFSPHRFTGEIDSISSQQTTRRRLDH